MEHISKIVRNLLSYVFDDTEKKPFTEWHRENSPTVEEVITWSKENRVSHLQITIKNVQDVQTLKTLIKDMKNSEELQKGTIQAFRIKLSDETNVHTHKIEKADGSEFDE